MINIVAKCDTCQQLFDIPLKKVNDLINYFKTIDVECPYCDCEAIK